MVVAGKRFLRLHWPLPVSEIWLVSHQELRRGLRRAGADVTRCRRCARRDWARGSLEYRDCEPAVSQQARCDRSPHLVVPDGQFAGWADRAQAGVIDVGFARGVAVDMASEYTRDANAGSRLEEWLMGWAAMQDPDMRLRMGEANIRRAKHGMP